MSPNSPTIPHEKIRPLTTSDHPESPFYNPEGGDIPPVARVVIRRIALAVCFLLSTLPVTTIIWHSEWHARHFFQLHSHDYQTSQEKVVVHRDRKGLSIFSNGVSNYNRNSLYYHHQNTLKPCFTTISVFR